LSHSNFGQHGIGVATAQRSGDRPFFSSWVFLAGTRHHRDAASMIGKSAAFKSGHASFLFSPETTGQDRPKADKVSSE